MLKDRAEPVIRAYTAVGLRKRKTETLYRQTKASEVCCSQPTLQEKLKRISGQRKMTSNGKVRSIGENYE